MAYTYLHGFTNIIKSITLGVQENLRDSMSANQMKLVIVILGMKQFVKIKLNYLYVAFWRKKPRKETSSDFKFYFKGLEKPSCDIFFI